ALPLLKVREVIGMPDLTSVPQAPPHVVGIINLIGQIITIFDLRSSLKSQTKNEQPTVIICEMEFGQMGLIVDLVTRVLSAESDKMSAVPPGSRASHKDYITNVYSEEKDLILMLDVERLISHEVKILSKSVPEAA